MEEKWCINPDENNINVISKWFRDKISWLPRYDIRETYWHFPPEYYICTSQNILNGYKEITYKEFLQLTNNKLNEEVFMEKLMLDVLNKTYDNLILRRTTVPLFMSNPGIGKTQIIKKFAQDKGVKMVKITLSQRMPNEVVGMVMPDPKTKSLLVYDSHELKSLNPGDIVFFDEAFNGTLKQTLDACLNFVEDRILPSGIKLADVMIIAASNPQGLINITPQIKERFIRYDLVFNKEEWMKYLHDRYGVPASISDNLSRLVEKEKFDSSSWNFITPRSIEKAINQIGCGLDSPHNEVILPFLKQEMVSPRDIVSLGAKEGDKFEFINLLKTVIEKINDIEKEKQLKINDRSKMVLA